MIDSRSFDVPSNFDVEHLGNELVIWFRETKHLDARGAPLQDGFLVQARRRGNLRDWVGIDQALHVELISKSGRLEVRLGVSQGIDRFKERFPANVLFTPLALPAALGAWLQKDLPEDVFDWIKQHTDHRVVPIDPSAKPASAEILPPKMDDSATAVHRTAAEQQLQASGRYFQKGGVVEEELLMRQLQPKEIVLAWLAVAAVTRLPADSLGKPKAAWHYLLTTERSALVAHNAGGDRYVYELPAEPLHLSGSLMRYNVTVREFVWKTQYNNDDLYQEIALVPAADRRGRLRQMSRLNWLHREQNQGSAGVSRWLLRQLTAETNDPWDCLSSAYVEQGADYSDNQDQALDTPVAKAALGTCLARLLQIEESADLLHKWTQRWGLSTVQQMSVVQIALELEPAKESALMVLPLHHEVASNIANKTKDASRQAIVDLSFAKHLLQAEKHTEAVTVLEQRLANMPDESLLDLLPPRDVDLTKGGSQTIRCRILELLTEARGEPGRPDVATVSELARLQPLVKSRLKGLIEASSESLQRRAQAIYRLLSANGLDPTDYDEPAPSPSRTLPKKLVENRLPHPAARRGGAFEWLEGWLGKTKYPDYSALKSYVERVTADRHPAAMQALTDAANAFGIKTIEAYISRGEKEVGIRVYEGSPPFLLIGGAHLDPQSEFYLRAPELRFLVAGEIAHLHYHHTRLTSSELWTGMFRKGTQILGVFGSLAGPLGYLGDAIQHIQNLKNSEILLRKAETVTGGAKKAVDFVGMAKDVQQVATRSDKEQAEPQQGALAEDNDKLLAAFRVMQLTADRAGLVLCGDIRAAVRAIFLSSRQYQAELANMQHRSLAEILDQGNTEDDAVNQDLVIRLAALCSFYLTNDYTRLRHALTGD